VIQIYRLKQVYAYKSVVPIVWVATKQGLRFRKGSENRSRRGDQNLNLSCIFSNLSVSVWSVA